MNIAEIVREARERKGWSQTKLAEEAGTSQYSISQIETGATKAPTNHWRAIATALDIPEEVFAELIREAQRSARTISNLGRRSMRIEDLGQGRQPETELERSVRSASNAAPRDWRAFRKIDVLGRVAGSPLGEGHLIMSEVINRTECPPWLDDVPGAYALRVTGESMVPRFMPDELIYIDPGRSPARDDFVVVQVQPKGTGEVYGIVKQYVRHSDRGLILRQFTPKMEELPPIPMDTIHAIHKVVSSRIS